jgi:hypothetical protein
MSLQQRFEFSRSNLKPIIFDQFLQSVNNEKLIIIVNKADIACV